MERSELTLVPEWLKGSGNVSGGSTTYQTASSSSHSDDHVGSKPSRNKSLVSTNNHDTGRSFASDRTTSSYFRRSSSSNGSGHLRSHGSFGRSNRDRDWEKGIYESRDKEKSILGDHRSREYSDPLENILPSRFDKDLRRSHSMVTGKLGQTWPRKVPVDSSNAKKSNPNHTNGLLAGGSVHKVAFERDFPSLGTEERQSAPEIGRVSSPGLSTAIQSLPIGTSAVIGADGWTSALAEVPVFVGSNDTVGSAQQVTSPTSASLASSMITGLNMAETLAQGPSHAHTTTPQSSGTQRLEELAIKQSRQLIPMTPSMPKLLVPNPLEKPKPKIGQPQLQTTSHLANHSPRNGPVKSDFSRTSSAGKLHVLKPARERNGVSLTMNGSLSPTSGSRVASSPVAVASSVVGSAPLRSPSNNHNLASAERKPNMAILEKRPTPQAQSKNDFFNLVRKNSMTSPSSAAPAVTPSVLDKSNGMETGSAPVMPRDGGSSLLESFVGDDQSTEMKNDVNRNGNAFDIAHKSLNDRHQEPLKNGKDHSSSNAIISSEEEEVAFLRRLGWEESAEEDEGLTEEEINSFYKEADEYMKLRPSSRILQAMQPKSLEPSNPRTGIDGGGSGSSPGSSSSDSKYES